MYTILLSKRAFLIIYFKQIVPTHIFYENTLFFAELKYFKGLCCELNIIHTFMGNKKCDLPKASNKNSNLRECPSSSERNKKETINLLCALENVIHEELK